MKTKLVHSLTFRLTALYVTLFSSTMAIVFTVSFMVIRGELLKMVNDDLMDDISDIKAVYDRACPGNTCTTRLGEFFRAESEDDGPENKCYILWDGKGHLLTSSDLRLWGDVETLLPPPSMVKRIEFFTRSIPARPGKKARFMEIPLKDHVIAIGVPLKWNTLVLGRLIKAFTIGGMLAILFSVVAGWLIATRTLSKIKKIEAVAKEIATGSDLSRRVPLKGTEDELDQLSRTFNVMLQRLEAFVTELTEMLDNAAHDFKTPLARIRTMAETSLLSNDMNAIQGALVEIMNESDSFLGALNAIMDISEARTGLMKLKLSTVSLKHLLCEIEGLFSGVARGKGIEFRISHVDERLCIEADKGRLLQALLNIVDNAFKFTPPGGVVAVWCEKGDEFVKINVSDTGPGIPKDKIPRIFERFFTLDRSRSSMGRGIGLALAKAFIEAHGGRIHCESIPGAGTTFSIILAISPLKTMAKEVSRENQ